jgi:peptidyl-dipeptidase A
VGTANHEQRSGQRTLGGTQRPACQTLCQYAFLKELAAQTFADPLLARQNALLLNGYLGSQMDEQVIDEMIHLEVDIEEQFNTYRAIVDGKPVSDNEVDELLIHSSDAALRREAWVASKAVGGVVVDKLMHLVRLRNREAQRLGFDNYYAMSMQLQELDEERLFALLDTLKTESDPIWHTYKTELDRELAARFHITPDAVRPWHHANKFFQEPGPGDADLDRFFTDKNLEALTAQFFAAIGLPVEDLLQSADLYEREGKCQHAFCMDMDRRGDVRVLCNCRSNERWMGTMLHEFGHAVYDKFTDHDLPYLLRGPAHTLTTEAIALFMGRLTKNADWLKRYAGVEPEEAERIAASAQRELRDHLLVFMRWCFVMAHFERELYRNPEQDLDALWWSLVAKYQDLKCPPEARQPGMWASKIHLASSPVYYHNYLLGEMVASQLLRHIQTVVLAGEDADALIDSPRVGAYLKEQMFYPGAVRPWEDWLEHATRERLTPSYFVQQLQ